MTGALLKFSGSVRRDPKVDAWFDARSGELGRIARRWFTRLRECGVALADPARLLQGDGRFIRHVKLGRGLAVADSALESLIVAAYLDIKARI
jgi:hypothetical protein